MEDMFRFDAPQVIQDMASCVSSMSPLTERIFFTMATLAVVLIIASLFLNKWRLVARCTGIGFILLILAFILMDSLC